MPKIADWGLARVLAERTGTIEGLSVTYAAPEQFEPDEFGDPDMLTDIYQVGALVHAILTGEPPYSGSQLSVVRDVVTPETPTPPSSHRGEMSAAIDAAVLAALEPDKRDRYDSIQAFKEALQAIRNDQRLPRVVVDRLPSIDVTSDTGSGQAPVSSSSTDPLTTDSGPAFQAGPTRSGARSTFGPQHSVTLRWSFETDNEVFSSPAVVDGTVYVGSCDHHVYALSASEDAEP